MAKRSKHPGNQLIEYLNGSLDADASGSIRQHLESCAECSRFAALVKALKQEALITAGPAAGGPAEREIRAISQSQYRPEKPGAPAPMARGTGAGMSQAPPRIDPYSKPELPPPVRMMPSEVTHGHFQPGAHPDATALESLFYSKTMKQAEPGTAAHVAVCRECSSLLGEYARAEAAAANFRSETSAKRVPESVFKRINEWEQSDFAKPKAAEAVLSEATLSRLLALVRTGAEGIREAVQKQLTHSQETSARPNLVPVVVVDRSGNAEGVEMFQCVKVSKSEHSLEHQEGSTRFDGRTLVAVLNAHAPQPEVSVSSVQGSSAIFSGDHQPPDVSKTHFFILGKESNR